MGLNIDALAPFGFLNASYDGVQEELPVPLLGKRRQYERLIDDLTRELSQMIWPYFDVVTGAWRGEARHTAAVLTEKDLELCIQLAEFLSKKVGDGNISSADHNHFFLEEDGFKINLESTDKKFPYMPWGGSLSQYDGSLDLRVCKQLSTAFDVRGIGESGGLDVALKIRMQRPRPFQVAMQLGYESFSYQRARTASSPSLVSGHALQALLSGCYVFREHQHDLLADAAVMDAWMHLIVDVGDRRVFAGVHYPSDSIASWFCVLRAIKVFYCDEADAARDLVWRAITTKSIVFAHVKEHAKRPRSPYKALVKWLAAEAES